MRLYNQENKKQSLLTRDIDDKYAYLGGGIFFILLALYFLITKDYTKCLIIIGCALFLFASYLTKKVIDKRKHASRKQAYIDIIADINSSKIKDKLVALGFSEDKIDYILETNNESLQFGVALDETCYFNTCVGKNYYEFAIEITDEIYDLDNFSFSEKANQIIDVYEKIDMTDETTADMVYQAFKDYVEKHMDEAKLIAEEANQLIKINNK